MKTIVFFLNSQKRPTEGVRVGPRRVNLEEVTRDSGLGGSCPRRLGKRDEGDKSEEWR